MNKTQMFFVAVFTTAAATVLNAAILQACWNYFVPAVFSLSQLGYFQAMILIVGVRSLVGDKDFFSKKRDE